MNSLKINGTLLNDTQMRDRATILAIEGCDEPLADFLLDWWSDDAFVVGHTSGSTGEPKRIELSKSSMIESAKRTNAFFGLRRGDSLLMCLSANYIAGKMMVVRAIVGGLDLYVQPASSMPVVDKSYDLVSMVPLQVHSLMESGRGEQAMALIKHLLVGGSQLMKEESDWLTSLPVKSYLSYGMTETVSHVALSVLRKEETPLYQALPDVRFSMDHRGCLVVHADYLHGSPFVTNDMVELLSKQTFRWLGRWDNVINTGGVKVFPEKMEKKVEDLLNVPYYFKGEIDPKFGQRVVLVVESDPFDTTTLNDALRKILSPYEMPKEILFVPRFSRTASGKVRRV